MLIAKKELFQLVLHVSFIMCYIVLYYLLLRNYRRRNYAFYAMKEVFQIARDKGYRIALDQVRTNNIVSIALHKKLGFETDDYEYKNKRERSVRLFLKSLL